MKPFTVSPAITSHMVLQRRADTRIWGKAARAGIKITVTLGTYTATAVSDIEKRWEAVLPAMEACTEPQTLTVSGLEHTECFEDVLIGEVYLVAGQSNAEMTFAAEEQTTAYYKTLLDDTPHYPLLRALVQHRRDVEPASFNRNITDTFANKKVSQWRVLNSREATMSVSILGYCFIKELFLALDKQVPVGLVMAASGGSPLYDMAPGEISAVYGYTADRNELIAVSGIYNTMVAPIQNMTFSGILFYQGESEMNEPRRRLYGYMLQSYVAELRRRFRAELPFYFVQLSSHPEYERSYWTNIDTIREAQFDTLKLVPHSYMVVARDCGWREGDLNMYHPYRKDILGKRMCMLALAAQFGRADMEQVCSPLPYEAKFSDTKAVIKFRCVAGGLALHGGAKTLLGFELCGADGVYLPAKAKITAPDTVEVRGVKRPVAVRFGHLFLAYAENANLENSAGLPAPCFELHKDIYKLNV